MVPEASFWAEALPEDEAALFGAACELRLGGELLAACAAGEVEEVLELLRQPAADDRELVEHAGGPGGRTPLIAAARAPRRGARPPPRVWRHAELADVDGRTALWWACREDHASAAALLLDAGALVAADGAGLTPLRAAAREGCDGVVQMLLEKVTKAEAADANASPKKSSPSPPKKSSPLSKAAQKAKPPLHDVAVEASDEALEREAAALGHDDTAGALRCFREARGGGGASRPLLGKRCRVVEALGRPELKDRLGHAFEWDDEASRYRVRLDSRLMYAEVECDDGSPASKNGWAQAEAEEVALRPDQLAAASAADEAGAAAGGGGAAPAAPTATAAPAWQPPAIDERGRDERGVPIWNRPPAFVLEEQMRDPTVTAAVARVNANGH